MRNFYATRVRHKFSFTRFDLSIKKQVRLLKIFISTLQGVTLAALLQLYI